MKILYVSQYYPPEMGAPSARASELAKYWAQDGHQVTVLTGFPNHPTGVVPPEYRSRFRRLISRDKIDGVNVVRSWLLPFPNRKAYERILNYSSFCVSAALTGMFLPRPDIVIATSPQLLVGLSGWWIARIKRAPFIFEVRDLWPESLTAVGAAGEKSLLHRVLRRVADFLYCHSDHIVVVTSAFKKYLVEHNCAAAEKISTVENGVDIDLFSPKSYDPGLRQSWQSQGRFVVSYIGTMGMAHGLETLLQAAVLLRNSPVLFVLLGEGADKQRIKSVAHEHQLTNLLFLDQVPRERVPVYIAASDACLVLLKKAEIFKTVIPTKMLEFMACARPVIVAVDGQAREIMEEAKAGIFVEPENAPHLAAAILRLQANPELGAALGESGRTFIQSRFSRRQSANDYASLLQKLERGFNNRSPH